MNHNMRRLKQSVIIGALIGVGLWVLFIIAVQDTWHLPKNIYLLGLVSFLSFALTTALISFIFFYAIPTYIAYLTLKYMAANDCESMQDNLKEHHFSMNLWYRLLAGLIFAVAAVIAMPVYSVAIAMFTDENVLTVKKVLGYFSFGAVFSIAAFLWGAFLSSRFHISDNKSAFSFVVISFLWGCVVTALTIFSTGFFIGLFESIRHMEVSLKAFEYGFFVWGLGSAFTFGVVYVVGGAAGVITGIYYHRVSHNNAN
jgi:hypothetical protein